MLSRPRTQPYGQLLLGAATTVVTATGALAEPERLGLDYLAAVTLILLGCIAMVVVGRARPTRGTEWICVVPLADILACVPIRHALIEVLPTVGFLVVFPIAWLAFAFPRLPIIIGVVLTVLLPMSAFQGPDTRLDSFAAWASVLTLPAVVGLFALATRAVAVDLLRQKERVVSADTRMAESLRSTTQNRAALQALADATPGAMAVFDRAGNALLVNNFAKELTQRSRAMPALAGGPPAEVYEADRTTRMPLGPNFLSEMRDGEYVAPRQVWIGPPDDQIAITFVARPVVDGDETIGAVLLAQDVTDLVRAVEVRDTFLDAVGHELRTPLTVIMGHTDVALAGALDERMRTRFETIDRAATRLHRMVERLISAGRARRDARTGSTVLAEILGIALQDARRLAADRGVEFAVVADPLLRAQVDSRDLAEIVEELATNAVWNTPRGGSVVVDARAESDARVVVEVTDTGRGMTEEERARAFDRFYRTGHARAEALPGAGLGLAIARSLAESNGARLTLDPHPRTGTIATLALAVAPTDR